MVNLIAGGGEIEGIAMYELVQVAEHTYYIESPAKIGLVETTPGEAVLIDSGGDRSAAKKARNHLEAHAWNLRAIYTTHSHADHTGGCHYLQANMGCSVYAPGAEQAFTNWPWLEPTILYGGYPPANLRHKFLMAQASDAQLLTPGALPQGWEAIELPGHFFQMVGYRTPDDVVFLADCLSSEATLRKYRLSFLYDVAGYLRTLEAVVQMKAKLFVPAHAAATNDIAPLARLNIETTLQAADDICTLCAEPIGFDDLLAAVFAHYDLRMTFEQHALVGSTVRSYLSYLANEGRVRALIDDNHWLWVRA